MFTQPYQLDELHFAYCYRVYLRWQTMCRTPCVPLAKLTVDIVADLVRPYNIKVLEVAASEVDLVTIVSLRPHETISACLSKLKGRISKWLNQELRSSEPLQLLSRGYFACTVGKSTEEEVEEYLEKQADHHGYGKRRLPPVFVERLNRVPLTKLALAANTLVW